MIPSALYIEQLLRPLCCKDEIHRAVSVLRSSPGPLPLQCYIAILRSCKRTYALAEGQALHSRLAPHKDRLCDADTDSLLPILERAVQAFLESASITVSSCNALLSVCLEYGRSGEALCIYQHMRDRGADPNSRSYVCFFKACANARDLVQGKKLHTDALSRGFLPDVFLSNTLINMYGKCGAMLEAEDAFCAMAQRTTISWNVMMASYAQHGFDCTVLRLYRQMHEEGASPDQNTLVLVIKACGSLLRQSGVDDSMPEMSTRNAPLLREIGHALHSYIVSKDMVSDIVLNNSLLSMYGKCGAVAEAENLLHTLSRRRNVVSWTIILSVHVEYGDGKFALLCYVQMQKEGVQPDIVSCILALQACASLADDYKRVALQEKREAKSLSLEIGRALQADIEKKGYISDARVGTALMNIVKEIRYCHYTERCAIKL